MKAATALVGHIRRLAPVPIPVAILLSLVASGPGAWAKDKQEVLFEESRIFIEYNASDNDLGFHVFLDGEDWKTLKIVNPKGRTIFDVQGRLPASRSHGAVL